jgi:hypothetical protein
MINRLCLNWFDEDIEAAVLSLVGILETTQWSLSARIDSESIFRALVAPSTL